MLSFYSLPEAVRVAFSIATVLAAMVAAIALILQQYRYRRGLSYWLGIGITFLTLCQMVLNVVLVAHVQHNMTDRFIVPGGYELHRYIVFFAMIAVSAYPIITRKSFFPIIPLTASFLTLPIVETWASGVFPLVFAAALLLLIAGSLRLVFKIRVELMTSISGLSIKQAMDSLNTAVLFYKKNGRILLQNNMMQELMIKTAGHVIYNGRVYFETIVVQNAEKKGTDSYLYRMENRAWLYTTKEIRVDGKTAIRLTAADVTDLDRINKLLHEKHLDLKEQEKQLKDLAGDLEEIARSEELLRVKAEAHNAENRKLTLLLQHLRHGGQFDKEIFSELGESLRSSIVPEQAPKVPSDEMEVLIDTYEKAGIHIQTAGELPENRDIASALVYILREAAANAVIHGYAEKIFVSFETYNNNSIMCVTDNLTRRPSVVREGSGITGMRRRLEKLDGKLDIETSPEFKLSVTIPLERRGLRE